MTFFSQMSDIAKQLETRGYTCYTPKKEGIDIDYAALSEQEQRALKKQFIDAHIEKIQAADAILVVNLEKNGMPGYIGANTFMEIAFGYLLDKRIYILNDIVDQPYTTEIAALEPILLHGDVLALQA